MRFREHARMRGVMMRVEESIMRNTPTFVAICVAALGLGSIASAQAPCRAVEIDRRGAEEAYVFDLNNWGQVVGALATTPEGQVSHIQPFVWENGRTRLLEAPTQVSEAHAINAFGRVVGTLYEADFQVRPVTWTRGRLARLASVPQALAVDVNNRGQIIGYNSMSRGVLWQSADSEPVDLGTLGGGMAQPAAINDHGVIVGVSATVDNALHGFVWQDGVLTDIGLPDHPDAAIDIVRTALAGINDDGLAIGSPTPPTARPIRCSGRADKGLASCPTPAPRPRSIAGERSPSSRPTTTCCSAATTALSAPRGASKARSSRPTSS
jgi:probable HAF family extracellular repeat protein